MSNETNETIVDIVSELRSEPFAEGGAKPWLHYLADRIEAAHKREMADEKRISDAVVQSLRDKKLEMAGEIAAKEAEIAELHERIKIAEEALEKCVNYNNSWELRAAEENAKNALAAIREKGEEDDK